MNKNNSIYKQKFANIISTRQHFDVNMRDDASRVHFSANICTCLVYNSIWSSRKQIKPFKWQTYSITLISKNFHMDPLIRPGQFVLIWTSGAELDLIISKKKQLVLWSVVTQSLWKLWKESHSEVWWRTEVRPSAFVVFLPSPALLLISNNFTANSLLRLCSIITGKRLMVTIQHKKWECMGRSSLNFSENRQSNYLVLNDYALFNANWQSLQSLAYGREATLPSLPSPKLKCEEKVLWDQRRSEEISTLKWVKTFFCSLFDFGDLRNAEEILALNSVIFLFRRSLRNFLRTPLVRGHNHRNIILTLTMPCCWLAIVIFSFASRIRRSFSRSTSVTCTKENVWQRAELSQFL